jgi:hypothetical protein
MDETVRSASQRKTDTVARLEGGADVWVAIDDRTIMRNGQWTAV